MTKTNLSRQTKYFKQIFNRETLKFELKEIPLGRDTWWYVQVDATIRTTFLTYNLPLPKYVIIEQHGDDKFVHMIFKVFRETIKNPKELKEWNEKWIYVYDELQHQAKFNSNDDEYLEEGETCLKYEFKLL